MNQEVQNYNDSQSETDKVICEVLYRIINENLPHARTKSGMHIPFGF